MQKIGKKNQQTNSSTLFAEESSPILHAITTAYFILSSFPNRPCFKARVKKNDRNHHFLLFVYDFIMNPTILNIRIFLSMSFNIDNLTIVFFFRNYWWFTYNLHAIPISIQKVEIENTYMCIVLLYIKSI